MLLRCGRHYVNLDKVTHVSFGEQGGVVTVHIPDMQPMVIPAAEAPALWSQFDAASMNPTPADELTAEETAAAAEAGQSEEAPTDPS